ncbi:MAG: TldD/PmbA family protein [Bacteroidota bacterium]
MEDILAEARRRGAEAEVFEVNSRETSIEFENNRLKKAETVERAGLAVRVIHRGRLGFATSSLPADRGAILDRALATADFGKEVRFSLPGPSAARPVEIYDQAVTGITPEMMVDYGEEIIAPMRAADQRFKAGVSLTTAVTSVALANTAGFAGETHKTIFGGSVGGILVEGENFLEVAEGHVSCRWTDHLRALRDRALAHLRYGRRNVPLASGRDRVLFTPAAHAALLGPLLTCLTGKAVEKGTSPFRDRLGEQAFAASFTLYDDPLRPFFPATSPFDGEGVPGRRTDLIYRGVLKGFFVDLDTAAALGVEPNGNGRRGGWSGPPSPGPSTIVVEPGGEPSHRLQAGLDEGLLVHHFLGAGQSNPYGGVVSANIMLGFLVRGGGIVGRVKNTMLTVNVFDLFRAQIVALSSDTEDVWGGMSLPYLLADDVSITVAPAAGVNR